MPLSHSSAPSREEPNDQLAELTKRVLSLEAQVGELLCQLKGVSNKVEPVDMIESESSYVQTILPVTSDPAVKALHERLLIEWSQKNSGKVQEWGTPVFIDRYARKVRHAMSAEVSSAFAAAAMRYSLDDKLLTDLDILSDEHNIPLTTFENMIELLMVRWNHCPPERSRLSYEAENDHWDYTEEDLLDYKERLLDHCINFPGCFDVYTLIKQVNHQGLEEAVTNSMYSTEINDINTGFNEITRLSYILRVPITRHNSQMCQDKYCRFEHLSGVNQHKNVSPHL